MERGKLVRLGEGEDTLAALKANWQQQASDLDETFFEDAYPEGIFEEIQGRGEPRTGIYALKSDHSYLAICQLNTTYLPGYTEPVMRMRHLTVSPILDLSDDTGTQYGQALVEVFLEVVNLCTADGPMNAKHIKFHLPSPADRTFFAAVSHALHSQNVFASVVPKGSWLHISF